jgi:aminoglycoside 3-N-acetyltransferase
METSLIELEKNLRSLGLGAGDTVMVHASLRSVGPVEGRAEGLVRTLLSVLGEPGTLLAYVDFEPTSDTPYFDPQKSPASSDYGILAEVIRSWPNAVRSLNPGASMAAIGARAEWICQDHPLHYGYGPGSPLAKLVEIGGKVLLLGSSLDNVTLLHYAEHWAKLPHKRIIRRTDKILSGNRVVEIEIEEFDTGEVVVSAMPADYFAQITKQFVAAGYAQTGIVGQAPSILLPGQEFVKFAIDKMEQEWGD